MHKAVQYFNEMANLEGQGVPINWQGVARQMAVIVANESPQIDKPAPLPEPPQ
jgi:hypothetical protein